ncbi:MAG: macro domain-containing protein, partial [Longimicrobiales bacterium]|nr:macro domain-containing protein [Longimicrobiales bacterium]
RGGGHAPQGAGGPRLIRVRRGELAEAGTECILRPVRADGAAVTGAARRLEAAGGDPVSLARGPSDEAPLGSALLTPGGGLAAAFVVHVVVQTLDEPPGPASVRRGLVNALRRAADFGIASLALPPLGSGAGSLAGEETAALMVEVLRRHLEAGAPPREFEIVVESEYDEAVFRRLTADGGVRP